ncbi:MAG: pyridoxamine 5'-phosphate oxidase family protein [Acidimicrobiia bacterium]
MKEQRKGRKIAMTPDEIDAFLRSARTCHAGSSGANGEPHVSPLWFVWDGSNIWLNSVVKSQRWVNLARDPRICIVVDGGIDFFELQGVEINGRVEQVGEVPRTSAPDPQLAEPELLFARKYMGSDTFYADGGHAWLRVVPDKIVSWDFTKMAKR